MPLNIVKDDLLKIKCDAIVNPTDTFLCGLNEVDQTIRKASGSLLDEDLINKALLNASETFVTKSYDLNNCQYIIHASIPTYDDGEHHEYDLLRCTYSNVLKTAKENHLNHIVIPLLNSDNNSFPKSDALRIAIEEINDCLKDSALQVDLVINHSSSVVDKEIVLGVNRYIDQNFIDDERSEEDFTNFLDIQFEDRGAQYKPKAVKSDASIKIQSKEKSNNNFGNKKRTSSSNEEVELSLISNKIIGNRDISMIYEETCLLDKQYSPRLTDFVLDESFSEALFKIIDNKGLKDPEVYKKALIDRKLFSTIRSKKNYKPSKKTAIALCIALELDLEQTNDLLKKAGFTLSHSNLFDVIIEYFVVNKHYDFYDINVVLLENDQELIGC